MSTKFTPAALSRHLDACFEHAVWLTIIQAFVIAVTLISLNAYLALTGFVTDQWPHTPYCTNLDCITAPRTTFEKECARLSTCSGFSFPSGASYGHGCLMGCEQAEIGEYDYWAKEDYWAKDDYWAKEFPGICLYAEQRDVF